VAYQIWAKHDPIPRMLAWDIIKKFPFAWYNGRVLRTSEMRKAKQIKKELEKYFGSNVYITEV
jgi:hypothetical protein